MNIVLVCIFAVLYSFIGAADIYFAIDAFKEQKYFWFGFCVMCTITQVAYIFTLIFDYA